MSPHATEDSASTQTHDSSNMGNDSAPLTNGNTPHSKSLSHLHSYPVVHDTFETFKKTQIGASTLNLASNTYHSFVAPINPYLRRPYSVAHPYLTKADELGDSGLYKFETYVPYIKEDTATLKQYAFAPFHYLHGTYQEQYQRTRGQDGVVKFGLAVVSTELKIVQDACTVFLEYWNNSETGKKVNEKVDQAKQ